MSTSPIDAVDRRILAALQEDASETNVRLAEKVGLSPSPCLARVRQLEESGVIMKRVALLDPLKVGERVVDAIRTKTFYAFVSAVPAEVIRQRHRRIEEALNSPWVTHY